MRVTLWGTTGSMPSPGPDRARYGGNTSCVEVRGDDGTILILDAGSGIRGLGQSLRHTARRVDILLTHLHLDHIQGLGFFTPLHQADAEVHIWGPASTTASLRTRLVRYLSPPLFPVHLRDLPCRLELHEVPCTDSEVGPFRISAALVCHPGPTVGYRLVTSRGALAYLPDHEPALGIPEFPMSPQWTSGHATAAGVDLLIHDAQYTSREYMDHVGWGHSSFEHALKFAALAAVKHFVPFHHDPAHDDRVLDQMIGEATEKGPLPFGITPGTEGAVFDIG